MASLATCLQDCETFAHFADHAIAPDTHICQFDLGCAQTVDGRVVVARNAVLLCVDQEQRDAVTVDLAA